MKNIARGTSRRDARDNAIPRASLVQFCIVRNLHDYINHASVAKHRIDRLSCDPSCRRLLSNYRFPLRAEFANQVSTSLLYSRDTPLPRVTETV